MLCGCQEEDLLSMDEGRVASREKEKDEGEDADPCEVWLTPAVPWKTGSANALLPHRVEEAQVDATDDGPVH